MDWFLYDNGLRHEGVKEKSESRSVMALITTSCPVNIHLLKVLKRNTRKRCEICSKLTKTPERCQ